MTVEDLAAHKGRHSDSAEGDGDGRPVIRLLAGKQSEALDRLESVLIDAGPGPVFQRGGQLVHIANRPALRPDRAIPGPRGLEARSAPAFEAQDAIVEINHVGLREVMGRVARFERYARREKVWLSVDPPLALAEAYAARALWRIPALHAVIGTPTLRADGSLLAAQGYDPQTGLYLSGPLLDLRVPETPTSADAESANETLVDLLGSFPFADHAEPGVSLAVALAGLLGAILRPTLPVAPLIAVTAPAAGTGKSYLVDLISVIATGHRSVAIATGNDEAEMEKSIGAALLSGRPLVLLDNLTQALRGQMLCLAITHGRVAVRILGQSKNVEIPAAAAWYATGNNLRIRGDMQRRALVCRLDARLEHPEQRDFDGDLLEEAGRRRAELVSAALTIARWQVSRGAPATSAGRKLAGFEAWCARVRDPLVALGHADPVMSIDQIKAADSETVERQAFVAAWFAEFGAQPVTVQEAMRKAEERDGLTGKPVREGLFSAFSAVGGDARGLNPRRLGNYLARNEDLIVSGKRITRGGLRHQAVLWLIQPVVG